ncbi:uncharacterized protein M421DRAFT_99159 [Didymella exigua CBS 183.55]|uniref:Uncharacterized protein n=1 Tax=Didymella exigua CBS 183.55 TaxID=1150837 RepID=A0A6A5RUX0_9PLEO|nr:uncharacterized protein M421DRAFT_99159 [Didymella exigua CBS 183.55]KAF1931293.1 hypothetical protein M421DRAFT_99159 [Didymella exigua CBS 183.55]
MANRPKSMNDFTALMDASMPLFESKTDAGRSTSPARKSPERGERATGHSRKKPSMSLAQGLIINGELHPPKSPYRQTHSRVSQDGGTNGVGNGEESLFYAYALKSDYANSPPYLLTFATSDICAQWWSLVQQEYPQSTRPGAQLFVLKTDDMQAIQDDSKFISLRNKWFFTSQDRSNCATPVIPLQGATGHLIAGAPLPQARPAIETPACTSVEDLAEKLERLSSVVESSAEHIHALSVAQSAGLQRMQEINESNSTQIKQLAESQAKLQSLIDQNASHYIALSNTSFKSHEQVKDVLQATTVQIQSLSGSQEQLTQTCKAMMRSISNLASSIHQPSIAPAPAPPSEVSTLQSTPPSASRNSDLSKMSPAPRKLNRRIRGVWYEYDNSEPRVHGAPRKLADAPVLRTSKMPATPPRTPRKLTQT